LCWLCFQGSLYWIRVGQAFQPDGIKLVRLESLTYVWELKTNKFS